MTGFTSPNHTQTPNELFDVHMLAMGECELKVTLAIIRKTLGYHKKSDQLSLSQLQKLTGLSRQGVIAGTDKAIERGLVEIIGTGKRGVLIYGLVINFDQSELQTDEVADQSKNQTRTSQKSRHTKETTQKKKEKKESTRKPKWANEDALIDVWAGIRGLDAIAMGADYHSEQDRKLAKKLLAWAKPITPDEIRLAMQRTKYAEYPFSFLEKDVLAIRAEKPAAVHPSHVPFPAVEATPEDIPATPEAIAALQLLKTQFSDEVTYAKSA